MFRHQRNLLLLVAAVVLFLAARHYWQKPRFIQGERLPDFSIRLADGSSLSREDLEGHYTLLHFWGSWCGPCRKENLRLAALYRDWKDRGLAILSVGVEKDSTAWMRARLADGLDWSWHYADFQHFSGEMTRRFGVREIPATYLVDPDGIIIGVNLPAEDINRMLEQRLAEN